MSRVGGTRASHAWRSHVAKGWPYAGNGHREMGSRAGPVPRETQAAAATHSSVAMRRLARAVDGATTEAGAWKPDEAMVMSEAAMVRVGDHSGADANVS